MQCESDPGAQQVLRRAFPGVLLEPDACALRALPEGTQLLAAAPPVALPPAAPAGVAADGSGAGGAGDDAAAAAPPRAGGAREAGAQTVEALTHTLRLLRQALADGRPVEWVVIELVGARGMGEAHMEGGPEGG